MPHIGISNVREEILDGLNATPKFISPKIFYDGKGSDLFEKITRLEEYYPTRTEKEIITSISENLNLNFEHLNIIKIVGLV